MKVWEKHHLAHKIYSMTKHGLELSSHTRKLKTTLNLWNKCWSISVRSIWFLNSSSFGKNDDLVGNILELLPYKNLFLSKCAQQALSRIKLIIKLSKGTNSMMSSKMIVARKESERTNFFKLIKLNNRHEVCSRKTSKLSICMLG